jgi:ATP-dependent Clp protease ATP-binding subunit ClpC
MSGSRIRWNNPAPQNPTPPPTARHSLLDQLGRDLTALARAGQLRPIYGREKELNQIQRILLRRNKNAPLLVGLPGVGKTALVEGLAQWVVSGKVAPALIDMRIVEIPAASLTAGTALRGSFEARLQALLAETSQDPNLVLFFDEIHTLVRAGAVEGGALDAANLLKPALARGELRCIGATTPDEFDGFIQTDPAFERRFDRLQVEEPDESETIRILNAACPEYEQHHHLSILPEAVQAAVNLSQQYLPDRRLPDKAFDLLDSACAWVRLPDPQQAQPSHQVDQQAVAAALADRLGVQPEQLTARQVQKLNGLENFMASRIFGQPFALARISAALRRPAHARRPWAVLALIGSSGSGKTSAAQALADYLFGSQTALIQLNLSEYKEVHSISRLLGAPPGYAGYHDENSFASRLRHQPFTLVLLDEVEKAHPEVLDLFLHIFDSGQFNDARGRRVDARRAVFVLTSNLFTAQAAINAEEYAQQNEQLRQNLGGFLPQELVNRLDEVILFGNLSAEALAAVAQQALDELNQSLAQEQIQLAAGPEVFNWLAAQSSDGREVLRLFQRWITEKIPAHINSPAQLTAVLSQQGIEIQKQ